MQIVKLISLIVISSALVSSCAAPELPDESSAPVRKEVDRGEKIVAKYLKADSSEFRNTRVRLRVAREDRPPKTYVLDSDRWQDGDETRTLTRVMEPREDSDIATLTIEQKGKPAVNIVYISSQKRFRETGTDRMFFGGLTSQELLGEWDKYSHKLIGETELDGKTYLEVGSKLKDGRKSPVAKINTLFDSKNHYPVRLLLFDPTGRKIRTFTIEKTKEVKGHFVAEKTVVENHVRDATITLELLSAKYPETMDKERFEKEYLAKLPAR